jgi:hypothetical protein
MLESDRKLMARRYGQATPTKCHTLATPIHHLSTKSRHMLLLTTLHLSRSMNYGCTMKSHYTTHHTTPHHTTPHHTTPHHTTTQHNTTQHNTTHHNNHQLLQHATPQRDTPFQVDASILSRPCHTTLIISSSPSSLRRFTLLP